MSGGCRASTIPGSMKTRVRIFGWTLSGLGVVLGLFSTAGPAPVKASSDLPVEREADPVPGSEPVPEAPSPAEMLAPCASPALPPRSCVVRVESARAAVPGGEIGNPSDRSTTAHPPDVAASHRWPTSDLPVTLAPVTGTFVHPEGECVGRQIVPTGPPLA